MSLFNLFEIAGSGMSAQSIRLNTVSSNMANANNVSTTEEGVYRAKNPVFAAVMQETQNNPAAASVRVLRIEENRATPVSEYDPENSMANAEGYVYRSNVNTVEEMANMISASRSYQNNVEVMNTAKQLMLATLKIGQ